MEQVTILNYLT